jgi:hypothetical protein
VDLHGIFVEHTPTWYLHLKARLNLVLLNKRVSKYVLYMIVTTAVMFGPTTVVLGLIAVSISPHIFPTCSDLSQRHSSMITKLGRVNLVWDKVQLAAFFVQETFIGLLYMRETASHLRNMSFLSEKPKNTQRVLHHLIYPNAFIICLDCSLIGLCYAGFFFLQGFYKAAIYTVKLCTEFTILNQLRLTCRGIQGAIRTTEARMLCLATGNR